MGSQPRCETCCRQMEPRHSFASRESLMILTRDSEDSFGLYGNIASTDVGCGCENVRVTQW